RPGNSHSNKPARSEVSQRYPALWQETNAAFLASFVDMSILLVPTRQRRSCRGIDLNTCIVVVDDEPNVEIPFRQQFFARSMSATVHDGVCFIRARRAGEGAESNP